MKDESAMKGLRVQNVLEVQGRAILKRTMRPSDQYYACSLPSLGPILSESSSNPNYDPLASPASDPYAPLSSLVYP